MSLDPSFPNFHTSLANLLESQKVLKNLKKAEGERVLELADFLCGILEEQISDAPRRNPRHKVQRLCTRWRVLPKKLVVHNGVECSEDIAARGGFSEARKGTYRGEEVAVKCILVSVPCPKGSRESFTKRS